MPIFRFLAGVVAAFALLGTSVVLAVAHPPRPVVAKPAIVEVEEKVDAVVESIELELDLRLSGAGPGDSHMVAVTLVQEARKAGFDPWFILAVIEVESNFNIEACSSSGALGLMQMLPSTFRSVSKHHRVTDPVENVRAGIAYLGKLYVQGFKWPRAILQAYNGGPNAAVAYNKALRAKEDISSFPVEMVEYPDRVLERYRRLLKMQGVKTRADKAWRLQ